MDKNNNIGNEYADDPELLAAIQASLQVDCDMNDSVNTGGNAAMATGNMSFGSCGNNDGLIDNQSD